MRGPDAGGAGLLERDRTDGSVPRTSRRSSAREVPQRADGLELIGEFEASGYEEAPSLVRRRDGQVVQLTDLLFLTLQAIDGERDVDAVAEQITEALGRTATAENVRFLLDEKLRPLGLVKRPDGSEPDLEKANPLLALRLRIVLSSERLTNRLTAPFSVLFKPPIVVAVLAGFAAVCTWVLFFRGLAQGARDALYSPGLLLAVFGLTILSAGFHEFGHAAACRYGGARPGVMGAGIYLVWPAFYTDVTDAYRLGRAGRIRTDLGGLYFNCVFVLGTFGLWAATGADALLLAVPLQLLEMVHQLLPFIRMDGYYILSDLTGVPDLFARIKPTLRSALPGVAVDERAARLKPRVRLVVTIWVLLVVPLLAFSLCTAAVSLPRLVATAWDSLGALRAAVGEAVGEGKWLSALGGVVSMLALILPIASSIYMILRVGRRFGTRAWDRLAGHPALRTASAVGAVALAVGLAWLWWPNGEYRPLQPGERGTVGDVVAATEHISTGRPGLVTDPGSDPGSLEPGAPPVTLAPSTGGDTPTDGGGGGGGDGTTPTTTDRSGTDTPTTTGTTDDAPVTTEPDSPTTVTSTSSGDSPTPTTDASTSEATP